MCRSGIDNIHPPHKGTKAYQRMIDAAEGYMREVKKMEQAKPVARTDSENYFTPKRPSSSSSETARREFHNQLAMLLFGKFRTGMSKHLADQVSNFAAFVTGHDDYKDSW